MRRPEIAISAQNVHKHYQGRKDQAGLNGFNLEVRSGSVCGLLGPNGAGKTTAVKILATLLELDAGKAQVAGFDVTTQAHLVRQNIGLVGQYAAIDEILTGNQNLVMFGQLNHLTKSGAQKRADELLEQFSLKDVGRIPVSQYSGGMRRRLDLAASLIVSPPILFVDEPTTGLDPAGRREVWGAIQARVAAGTTVLLTSQYLEEADQLANRISILRAGQVIAEGTPDELKATLDSNWLDIVLRFGTDLELVMSIIQPVAAAVPQFDADTNRLSIPVRDRTKALIRVATALAEAGIEPHDIALRRPTLDEVFIQLTSVTQMDQLEMVR